MDKDNLKKMLLENISLARQSLLDDADIIEVLEDVSSEFERKADERAKAAAEF